MFYPRLLHVRALLLTSGAIVSAFILSTPRVVAQAPPPLSAERAAAFIEAYQRRLDYLPGEVLVKFKPGVTIGGQQRALMALRSRPAASELKWIGDVALLTDRSQRDSRVLAQQLSEQP